MRKAVHLEISETIKRAENEYCTGDQDFSIVEILEMVLPDGSTVIKPTMCDMIRDDLVEDGQWDEEKHSGFEFTEDEMMGFTIILPGERIGAARLASQYALRIDHDEDLMICMIWIVNTLKRILDLQGRYSLGSGGPDYMEAISGPSLSFKHEIYVKKREIQISFYLDDSTR